MGTAEYVCARCTRVGGVHCRMNCRRGLFPLPRHAHGGASRICALEAAGSTPTVAVNHLDPTNVSRQASAYRQHKISDTRSLGNFLRLFPSLHKKQNTEAVTTMICCCADGPFARSLGVCVIVRARAYSFQSTPNNVELIPCSASFTPPLSPLPHPLPLPLPRAFSPPIRPSQQREPETLRRRTAMQ